MRRAFPVFPLSISSSTFFVEMGTKERARELPYLITIPCQSILSFRSCEITFSHHASVNRGVTWEG